MFLFHFTVGKALKKNHIENFFIFMRFWGGKGQLRSAQWVFTTLPLNISKRKLFSPRVFAVRSTPNCLLNTYQVWGRKLKKWKKNLEVQNFYSFWNWNSVFGIPCTVFLGLPELKKIKDSYYLFISFSCSKGLGKKVFWGISDFHEILGGLRAYPAGGATSPPLTPSHFEWFRHS